MALTQWQLRPVATETTIASGDFLAFTDEDESGDPINKITIDNLATFLAGGANLSASAGVLTATDTDTNTTYTGGTNLTLAGTVFNVDDSFLINSGSDVTAGTITMAHLIVGDAGNIGSASDGDAIAIASTGVVTFSQNVTLAADKVINLGDEGQIVFTDDDPSGDHTATGIVVKMTALTGLGLMECVFIDGNGKLDEADADLVTTMPAIGIALEANASGSDGEVKILIQGIVKDASWSFTPGADLFVGTTDNAGLVTATAPSATGDTVQKIGVALTATTAFLNFNTTEVLLA